MVALPPDPFAPLIERQIRAPIALAESASETSHRQLEAHACTGLDVLVVVAGKDG
jgi:hypothetical protein